MSTSAVLPSTDDCKTATLRVSRTYLVHAVLAHRSPELRTLDRIITIRSQRTAPITVTSILSLPVEILLVIRAYLHPMVLSALLDETAHNLTSTLLSCTRGLCAECLRYNVQVFGSDPFAWAGSSLIPSRKRSAGAAGDAKEVGCLCGMWEVDGHMVETAWRRQERERVEETLRLLPSAGFSTYQDKAADPRHSSPTSSSLGERPDHPTHVSASPAFSSENFPQACIDASIISPTLGHQPVWPTIAEILLRDFDCTVSPASAQIAFPASPSHGLVVPAPTDKSPLASDDVLLTPAGSDVISTLMRTARELSLDLAPAGTPREYRSFPARPPSEINQHSAPRSGGWERTSWETAVW
ncbi:hypothetical protein EWM64_g4757 [Hericium alpestre]|uniref:Uncharacterized protein n=1 Tax=Hericium alpestre TaxID=135208 RepID=A0A4Y9ZWJ2_9AGAM|nr:hypothetical protein EWM64_g4757 [Hericium alpestre]